MCCTYCFYLFYFCCCFLLFYQVWTVFLHCTLFTNEKTSSLNTFYLSKIAQHRKKWDETNQPPTAPPMKWTNCNNAVSLANGNDIRRLLQTARTRNGINPYPNKQHPHEAEVTKKHLAYKTFKNGRTLNLVHKLEKCKMSPYNELSSKL